MQIKKAKEQQQIFRAKEQSIKVKTQSIKLAGVQGAKTATRQVDGGQEVLDAAMTAYVVSKPVRVVTKQGVKRIKKKAKEEKEKRIKRKEQKVSENTRKTDIHSDRKSDTQKKGKNPDSGHSDK